MQPGDVLAYYGDLGAGKTAFTRGLASSLGVTEPVTSPTYTIVDEYLSGRRPRWSNLPLRAALRNSKMRLQFCAQPFASTARKSPN